MADTAHTYSLRTALQRELARGTRTTEQVARETMTTTKRVRDFAAGRATLTTEEASALGYLLGVQPATSDPLWDAAAPFRPDDVVARFTAGHVEVHVRRRGVTVRSVTGRTLEDAAAELRRVTDGRAA